MGLQRELVKSVFSRSRSGAHDGTNGRSAAEKRRWSSVRSYLCGEEFEFDSMVAEEDSTSFKSSEATVMQPVTDDLNTGEGSKNVRTMEEEIVPPQSEENSIPKLFNKEDAAIIIQSTFRRYLARRPDEPGTTTSLDEDDDLTGEMGSPSKAESISTSIEVQTSHSMEVPVRDERLPVMSNLTQHKTKIVQALKQKEDWDDSTVSSNISRMRIQHKLEAMIRREKALAYAFSQQLRICSKKRQMKTLEGAESDMGWSWLERWMATRESSIVTDRGNQKLTVGKRLLDLAGEEKESCGSNKVSVHLDSVWMAAAGDVDGTTATTNRIKTTPNRRPLPRKQCLKVYAQVEQ